MKFTGHISGKATDRIQGMQGWGKKKAGRPYDRLIAVMRGINAPTVYQKYSEMRIRSY